MTTNGIISIKDVLLFLNIFVFLRVNNCGFVIVTYLVFFVFINKFKPRLLFIHISQDVSFYQFHLHEENSPGVSDLLLYEQLPCTPKTQFSS